MTAPSAPPRTGRQCPGIRVSYAGSRCGKGTYGLHLCRNHPFIDGNKRIAAVAMGTFLGLNGEANVFDEVALYLAVSAVAEGRMDNAELAAWLRNHAAR